MSHQWVTSEPSSLAVNSGIERTGTGQNGSEPGAMVQQVRILVRHRWTIVGGVSLALVLALLFSLFTRPEYDAVTRIALDFGNADMLGNEKMKVPDGADVSNKLETQLA